MTSTLQTLVSTTATVRVQGTRTPAAGRVAGQDMAHCQNSRDMSHLRYLRSAPFPVGGWRDSASKPAAKLCPKPSLHPCPRDCQSPGRDTEAGSGRGSRFTPRNRFAALAAARA